MKNIVFTLFIVITFLGCSSSSNEQDTTIPSELIGTWQFKGFYTFDVYGENGMPLFTPYEDGSLTTYFENNTFTHTVENEEITGTYSVINNSILNISYFQAISNSTIEGSEEITLLTENVLEVKCIGTDLCDTFRYEKVLPD